MSGEPDYSKYAIEVDPTRPNNAHAFALELVGSGKRVLEVGCWTGHVTEHLVAAGNTVVGVEIDAGAAERARRFAERVHVVDLDTTSLATAESGPFDSILLGDVLEHLRDPAAVLRDLTALLAPDGNVVISLPHVGHIDVRLMLLEGRWDYQDEGLLDRTHLRWFTRASIRELLAEAGLVATEVRRVVIWPGDTNVAVSPGLHSPDVVRFIEADPEARTFQFVVSARRASDGLDDALADGPVPQWPDLAAERAELDAEIERLRESNAHLSEANTALANEVAAWQRSKLVRLTAPVRALRRRLRGRA